MSETDAPMIIRDQTAASVATTIPAGDSDGLYTLTCLLLGGTLEVTDLLLNRSRVWRATMAAAPKHLLAPDDETNADLLRYALTGLIIESQRRIRDQAILWRDLLLRSAGIAETVTRPVAQSWLLAPVRPSVVGLTHRSKAELARLIDQGRIEEAVGRHLARELTDDMVTLVLAYLGDKPEVRDFMQAQGTSLAGEVVDGVRDRSKTADAQIETLVHRLFRVGPRAPSSPSAKNASA